MYAEERRQHILKILKQKKRVDVSVLAEQLAISPETIRRDLNEMEAGGFLKRTHGGAIDLGDHKRPLIPVNSRKSINYEMKARIARRAAAFVEDGDVIAIDNSSTTFCLLEFIPRNYRLTIITNALHVVMEVASIQDSEWTCVCLGGVVQPSNNSTYGFLACNTLSFFQPKKLFMSCAGIAPGGLLTEGNLSETEIKRALIQCSQKTYLMVDETKWGQVGAVNEGDISELDCLITNSTVDPIKLEIVRDKGVEILLDNDS